MPDYYHAPALILTALFLPAFGYLYLGFRNSRSLLWLLGFLFSIVYMALDYSLGSKAALAVSHPWLAGIGQTSIHISGAMFLGSLSPLQFRLGRFRVLFVVPYTLVLIVYSILLFGVFGGVAPHRPLFYIFPLLTAICFGVGVLWGTTKGTVPTWVGVSFSGFLGCVAIWVCCARGAHEGLIFIESVNLLMAAVLLVFVFRRFSPGVFLSVLAFGAWSLSFLWIFSWFDLHPVVELNLARVVVMSKIVAAVGMILLTLEDELNANKVTQERERQVRHQLEAYANLILIRRRVEDFDRQGAEICETVAAHSRFSQAALVLESGGRYQLAGSAGLEPATVKALGALARRIPVAGFLAPGSAPHAAEHSQTLRLDLSPWLVPGDDLERLRFTSVLAVPMAGRTGVDGALLLKGIRAPGERGAYTPPDHPRTDDLLPIEMLAARVQATRSQTMLFEKLVDSEKYAGLGQLAGNVTQQLNNPLTVILGYASLLRESPAIDGHDRKAVESIVSESRRIRSTLESLSRVSRSHADLPAAVSVTELLADMEQLYRPEFLQRSIEFQVNIASGLPRILCGAQQLRQAVLHCLQYAIDAVEREHPPTGQGEPKAIRLEAAREGSLVQISVSHSGPGFLYPERAFDPGVPAQSGKDAAGMGLSLCASILRDQNGRASAVNLEPRGAAIILELRAA
jgi:signal transduction histidine kinase